MSSTTTTTNTKYSIALNKLIRELNYPAWVADIFAYANAEEYSDMPTMITINFSSGDDMLASLFPQLASRVTPKMRGYLPTMTWSMLPSTAKLNLKTKILEYTRYHNEVSQQLEKELQNKESRGQQQEQDQDQEQEQDQPSGTPPPYSEPVAVMTPMSYKGAKSNRKRHNKSLQQQQQKKTKKKEAQQKQQEEEEKEKEKASAKRRRQLLAMMREESSDSDNKEHAKDDSAKKKVVLGDMELVLSIPPENQSDDEEIEMDDAEEDNNDKEKDMDVEVYVDLVEDGPISYKKLNPFGLINNQEPMVTTTTPTTTTMLTTTTPTTTTPNLLSRMKTASHSLRDSAQRIQKQKEDSVKILSMQEQEQKKEAEWLHRARSQTNIPAMQRQWRDTTTSSGSSTKKHRSSSKKRERSNKTPSQPPLSFSKKQKVPPKEKQEMDEETFTITLSCIDLVEMTTSLNTLLLLLKQSQKQ